MGRIAVVVASRNRRELLLRTLRRHLALSERPRVVLVDDASADGTPEAVRAALPQVQVISLRESIGGAARNVGMEAIDEPYVALADDDSWWVPGALARAVALFDAHPRLAVLNARVLVGPEEREDDLCRVMAATPLPPAPGQPGYPILSFLAAAAVLRREAVLEVGGFSPRLGVGGEEELLSWDLAGAGWQLSYVPQLLAHHHPPRGRARPERREIGIRNTLWTTWLRRPAPAAARRTARQLLRFPADRTTVRGLARAAAGVPWVLRERAVSPPAVEAMRRMLEEEQLAHRRYVD